jgi:hypothetical protein
MNLNARTKEYLILCEDCGEEVACHSSKVRLCRPCLAKRVEERKRIAREEAAEKRQYNQSHRCRNGLVSYHVIYSPEGDFHPGCAFSDLDFHNTLHMGYFPIGMQFRNIHTGEVLQVTGTHVRVIERCTNG